MRHRMQLSAAVAAAACVAAARTKCVVVDGFQTIPHDTRQSSSSRNRRLSKTARPFSLRQQQKISHSRSRLWASTYNSAATAVAAPPGSSKSRSSSSSRTRAATGSKDVGVFDPIGYYAKSMSSSSSASCRSSSSTVATSEESNNLWKARGLVLIAAALYGTNFTLVKLLNEHIPSVGASTSLRFTLAALALVPFLFMNGDTSGNAEEDEATTFSLPQIPVLLAGMEVGLYNSVGYIAQALGLETTEASKSAFICSLAVVVVPIIDLLKGKTKSMKWTSIVGIVLAVVGVGLLELGGGEGGADIMMNSSTSMLPQLSMGDLFTFLQPLFFGLGFVRMEQALEDHPSEAKRLTAAQLTMVAIVSILNCWVLSPALAEHVPSLMGNLPPPPNMLEIVGFISNPSILGALIWTGIVTTALTIYLETLAMQTISAAEATLLFSTEPLWGAAFASVVGGEHLGQAAMAGASMILSGCTVSTVAGGSHDDDKKEEVEKMSCNNVGTMNDASLLASKVASVGLLVQTKALVEIRHVIERMMTSAGAATTNEGSQKVTMLPEMISAIVVSFESVRQQIKSFPLSIEETIIDS